MWHGLPVPPSALDMCVGLLCTGRPEGERQMIRSTSPTFSLRRHPHAPLIRSTFAQRLSYMRDQLSASPRHSPVICLQAVCKQAEHTRGNRARLSAGMPNTHLPAAPCQQLSPTSRVPRCAHCPTEPPAATRVSWIPPAAPPPPPPSRLAATMGWGPRGRLR
jgi:hypothetical protein